jgi:hypothetical protein
MKKIVVVLAFVFMFTLGDEAAKSMEDHMTPLSGGTSDVSNLTGKTVKNFQGDDLGTISEVVKGPLGLIAFAILQHRVTDNIRKIIAVPIDALSCGKQYCVLNASRETVRTAPSFVSMDDLGKTGTATYIYLYFHVQPYWTEK